MAGDEVAGRMFYQRRLILGALFTGIWAARGEAAAGLGVDGGAELTFHHYALGGLVYVRHRDSRQKRLRVGVQGLFKQLLGG